MKRWKAVDTYKLATGPVDVEHDIEELDEIADLIERGPDWNSLIDIRITLLNRLYDCTVEEQADPDFNPL